MRRCPSGWPRTCSASSSAHDVRVTPRDARPAHQILQIPLKIRVRCAMRRWPGCAPSPGCEASSRPQARICSPGRMRQLREVTTRYSDSGPGAGRSGSPRRRSMRRRGVPEGHRGARLRLRGGE
eukprot:scaffold614_cov367-Prasinococcus_capsulatus_cf.AAC.4